MQNVRNILSDVNILNASGVLKLADKKDLDCSTVSDKRDVFYCGLTDM